MLPLQDTRVSYPNRTFQDIPYAIQVLLAIDSFFVAWMLDTRKVISLQLLHSCVVPELRDRGNSGEADLFDEGVR